MLKLSYDNKHLTLSNRMEIEKELDKGTRLFSIAKLLCKDPRTFAKEVKKGER